MEIIWWHWVVIGLLLCISEIMTPGFFLLFIGLAGLVTGGINWFVPELSFTVTGMIFVVFSLGFSYLGKPLYKKIKNPVNQTLNKRGEQYIGQTFELVEDIQNNKGKIKVGDSVWTVRSEKELKTGDNVTVKSIDGTVFIVE